MIYGYARVSTDGQSVATLMENPTGESQWAWPWHDNGEVVGHGFVMFRRLLFGVLLAVSAQAASASATEECHAVHFKPGTYSITLRGTALPDQAICYTFATSAGQTADLRITGRNMILSVDGVGDAREAFTFKTKRQTYRFIVGQLMRSVTGEAYAVTLSVK
jgi:hypothetical protein